MKTFTEVLGRSAAFCAADLGKIAEGHCPLGSQCQMLLSSMNPPFSSFHLGIGLDSLTRATPTV